MLGCKTIINEQPRIPFCIHDRDYLVQNRHERQVLGKPLAMCQRRGRKNGGHAESQGAGPRLIVRNVSRGVRQKAGCGTGPRGDESGDRAPTHCARCIKGRGAGAKMAGTLGARLGVWFGCRSLRSVSCPACRRLPWRSPVRGLLPRASCTSAPCRRRSSGTRRRT